MKKAILFVCTILLITTFTGCGKSNEEKTTVKLTDSDVESMVTELLKSDAFSEELTELTSAIAISIHKLPEDSGIEIITHKGSSTAEEITVIKTEKVNEVKDMLKTYIEDQQKIYSDYSPQDVQRLKNYVMKTAGDRIVLVVGDDKKKVEKVLNPYFSNK